MKLDRLVLASILPLAPTAADPAPRKHGKQKKVKKLLRRFDRMIVKLDQDGDGRLGPDEVGDTFERFQRFDADQDAWVTGEEIIVVIEDRAQARKAKRYGAGSRRTDVM